MIRCCAATFVLFFLIATAQAQLPQERQLADQYFNNTEFDKAEPLYDKLMDKDPFGVYPQYFRCLLGLKEYDKTEKLVKKMIRKQPDNPSLSVDLGYVYQLQGQEEKATQLYDKTIKSLKADQNQIIILANAFLQRQQADYAIQTYLEGKRLMKGVYPFFFETADAYYQKGDVGKMIDEYLDAVADNPSSQQTILNILQSRIGIDPDNSRSDYLRTSLLRRIQKNPDQTEFSEMLIWLFIQQKDFDSALIQAKALDKRQKGDGSRIMSLGSLASSNLNYDAAIKSYQYVIEKGSDNPNYVNARMELLNTLNKKVTESNSYSMEDLYKLKKDYSLTLSELGRGARTATLVRGLAHLQAFYLDQPDSAISNLTEAIDFPGIGKQVQADCKLELGDVYLFTGNVWDSDLLYAQVDKDFKHDALGQEAKFRGARLDYFRGDFMWALGQLDVLKTATSQLIANDALALSLLISDNMGLDSNMDALMLYSKADLLNYRNKNDDALATLDSLLKQFPTHSLVDDAWFKMASIMDQRRNWQAEDSLYNLIIQKDSSSVLADDALYRRANLYETKLNNRSKAMDLYEELLIKYPGSLFVVEARKRYRSLRGDVVN